LKELDSFTDRAMAVTILERDESGYHRKTCLGDNGMRVSAHAESTTDIDLTWLMSLSQVVMEEGTTKQKDFHVLKILSNIFLPSGYPASVSPGMLPFLQVLTENLIGPFRLPSVCILTYFDGSCVDTF
jgi:hypothetical protein